MDLTLDYNVELFPLQNEDSFALALATSLARGGAPPGASTTDGTEDTTDEKERDVWRPDGKGRRGLEDDYDYVMYGKVSTKMHEYHHAAHHCISRTAYASFGGLLMSLTGSFRHLTSIVLGDPIYLLVRK
ncbi:hypothetical protein C0989_008981 [Termitomyces sp. Mn162]|nr:hypothetical protein C0989_008981 [Termitomyces sp. Mn162]